LPSLIPWWLTLTLINLVGVVELLLDRFLDLVQLGVGIEKQQINLGLDLSQSLEVILLEADRPNAIFDLGDHVLEHCFSIEAFGIFGL